MMQRLGGGPLASTLRQPFPTTRRILRLHIVVGNQFSCPLSLNT